MSTMTDESKAITTHEPTTGKNAIKVEIKLPKHLTCCSFSEPNLNETLEPRTQPAVDDPSTDEISTEVITSTLPTTGIDNTGTCLLNS